MGRGDGGDSQTWKCTQHVTIRKVFTNDTAYKGFVGKVIVRVNQRLNRSGVQKAVMKLENSTSPSPAFKHLHLSSVDPYHIHFQHYRMDTLIQMPS